ncbi:MYND finger domain-containing protein [Hirsutella rhossiliensis]
MATRTISVKLWCDFGATELEYRHSIPETLVTQAGRAQPSSEDGRRFLQWIGPILREHEAACRKAAEAYCESCSKLAKDILQSPMSFLHAETPFVLVVVSWSCGQEECEITMRQEMQDTVAEMGKADRSTGPKEGRIISYIK